jgi:hypothetical protein
MLDRPLCCGARGRGRAAKALGLDVRPHLQQLADEVIE